MFSTQYLLFVIIKFLTIHYQLFKTCGSDKGSVKINEIKTSVLWTDFHFLLHCLRTKHMYRKGNALLSYYVYFFWMFENYLLYIFFAVDGFVISKLRNNFCTMQLYEFSLEQATFFKKINFFIPLKLWSILYNANWPIRISTLHVTHPKDFLAHGWASTPLYVHYNCKQMSQRPNSQRSHIKIIIHCFFILSVEDYPMIPFLFVFRKPSVVRS